MASSTGRRTLAGAALVTLVLLGGGCEDCGERFKGAPTSSGSSSSSSSGSACSPGPTGSGQPCFSDGDCASCVCDAQTMTCNGSAPVAPGPLAREKEDAA